MRKTLIEIHSKTFCVRGKNSHILHTTESNFPPHKYLCKEKYVFVKRKEKMYREYKQKEKNEMVSKV